MRTPGLILLILWTSWTAGAGDATVKPITLLSARPCIECDATMLARARERIEAKAEPFHTYWQLARADAGKALILEAKPFVGRDSMAFHRAALDQGIAARLLAYWWRLENRADAGEKAAALLGAWAAASPAPGTNFDPQIRFPNGGMDVARSMLPFVAAYDLLQGHPALTPEKRTRIEAWFRQLVAVVKEGMRRWEANDDFGKQEFQNHHASHVLGLVLFGVTLRDADLVRLAIDSPQNPKDFRELIAGLILMPGDQPHGGLRGKPLHTGEIQDRYRTSTGDGLTYCHLTLTLLLYTADALKRATGEDYFTWCAPRGENLELPAAFYADFFRTRNAALHGGYYAADARNFGDPRGYLGLFEVALAHYPKNPQLQTLVRSMDRARSPRSWMNYYGLPLLTHGTDLTTTPPSRPTP